MIGEFENPNSIAPPIIEQPQPVRKKTMQQITEQTIVSYAKRLTTSKRKLVIDYIVKRDSPACFVCSLQFPNPYKADLCHINGKNRDWHTTNLKVGCHSCNAQRNKQEIAELKSQAETASTSMREKKNTHSIAPATEHLQEEVDYEKGSAEMQVTNRCELDSISWVAAHLLRDGYILWNVAKYSAAAEFGMSPSTMERYLWKYTLPYSIKGPFKRIKNTSTKKFELKPNLDHEFWGGKVDHVYDRN